MVPDRVKVPVPTLVRPMVLKPVPVPSFKVPPKVVLVLSVLTLSTELVTVELLVMMPLPLLAAIEPAVSEKPFISKVAVGLVNKISELFDKPVVLPSFKVPALIVVSPLKLLLPDRVKAPVPLLVRAIVLEPSWRLPLKVRSLLLATDKVTLLAPLLVMMP